MALILKKKSLPSLSLFDCDANGIATLKALGVAESADDKHITLWHGGKGYKLAMNWNGPPTTVQAELNSFMLYVLTEIEKKGAPASAPVQTSAPEPSNEVVPLRNATAMYQRVRGTSHSSVYVAVAISDSLKIAARVEGVQLSVRVEGSALDNKATVDKLLEQKLQIKSNPSFKYMSGHYTCTPDAPANKVLGAVLLGSGIEFETPLPKFSKVKGLCS